MTPPSRRSPRCSRGAANDLRGVHQYTLRPWELAQRGIYAAAIAAALSGLAEHPERGRDRTDLASGVRSHPVQQHVIFYHVSESEITVVRILHAKMDARGQHED